MQSRAQSLSSSAYKAEYISALEKYHEALGIKDSQTAPLSKLAEDQSLAIVTGQQLGVYGGPLFTVFKTMTAILLARKYEKELGRPVVPVFWMADEDHDFEEIAWTGMIGRNDYHKILLTQEGKGLPVSEEQVTDQIEEFRSKVKEELFDTDFSKTLINQLTSHYASGKSHVEAFAGLINDWFADEGLLIAGSNFKPIKELLASDFSHSITSSKSIYDSIESKSAEIEKEYYRQVMNGDTNLFYLSDKEGRQKIHAEGDNWTAGEKNWLNDELVSEIENSPEKFSPNVFLRPIIQDKLLPTLGYVAGPGELSYYGQMKELY